MDKSNEQLFVTLEKDLKPFKQLFERIVSTIMDQGVSNYPIVVLSQNEISIGIPISFTSDTGGRWNVSASTMEELIAKQVIHSSKIESFKSLFESHNDHFCLFVIAEPTANFVFITK